MSKKRARVSKLGENGIVPSGRSLGPGEIALACGLELMPTALTTSPPAECNIS